MPKFPPMSETPDNQEYQPESLEQMTDSVKNGLKNKVFNHILEIGRAIVDPLRDIQELIHEINALNGFYDTDESEIASVARATANIHAEASELWESYRNRIHDAPCDKAEDMVQVFRREGEAQFEPLTCA